MTNAADEHGAVSRREFLRRFIVGGGGVAVMPFPSLGADTFGVAFLDTKSANRSAARTHRRLS